MLGLLPCGICQDNSFPIREEGQWQDHRLLPSASPSPSVQGELSYLVCVLEGALCRGGGCWGLVFFHNLSLPQHRAVGKGSKRLMVVQPIPGISGLQAPSCVGDGWGRLGMLQLHFTVVFAFMSERHLHVHLKCLNHQTPFSQNEAQLSQSGPAWEFAPLEGVNVK